MAESHHKPNDIDVAQNSRKDVLISIDMKSASSFTEPVLLYKVEDNTLKAAVRDRKDKTIPNILFPKLTASRIADFLDAVPAYTALPDEDPDGRVEGQRYVLISEVVGARPRNVYYALLRRVGS